LPFYISTYTTLNELLVHFFVYNTVYTWPIKQAYDTAKNQTHKEVSTSPVLKNEDL